MRQARLFCCLWCVCVPVSHHNSTGDTQRADTDPAADRVCVETLLLQPLRLHCCVWELIGSRIRRPAASSSVQQQQQVWNNLSKVKMCLPGNALE